MAHRPYPNRDRALAHLRRQNPELRYRSELHKRLAPGAEAALEKAGRVMGQFVRSARQRSGPSFLVDQYRLSKR